MEVGGETCPRPAGYRSHRLSGGPQPGPARDTGAAQPLAGGYSYVSPPAFFTLFLRDCGLPRAAWQEEEGRYFPREAPAARALSPGWRRGVWAW